MSLATTVANLPLVSERRSYVVMEEQTWYWATLRLHLDIVLHLFCSSNYIQHSFYYKSMPKTDSKIFVLLQDFRGGTDGRVWLACTRYGCLCAIKFRNHDSADLHESEDLMREAS